MKLYGECLDNEVECTVCGQKTTEVSTPIPEDEEDKKYLEKIFKVKDGYENCYEITLCKGCELDFIENFEKEFPEATIVEFWDGEKIGKWYKGGYISF